jgi:hypothetical protein
MTDDFATILSDPVQLNAATTIVDLILKLAIALLGFYFAYSLSRQVALRVSERRLGAYSALWALTGVASPTRLREGGAGPLKATERQRLHDELAMWYYSEGNGMLLANGTRTMFLKVKDNLVRAPKELEPRSFSTEVLHAGVDEREAIRGKRAIRQLSLLRTRMKADLGVFGIHYGGGLTDTDKSFLKDCGELLWHRPWRKPFRQHAKELV